MANRNNDNIKIPIGLIVLSYIFYWPVGIVLTILRVVLSSQKQTGQNLGHNTGADMRAQNTRQFTQTANAQQTTTNPYYQQQMARQQQAAQQQAAQQQAAHQQRTAQQAKNAAQESKKEEKLGGLIVGGVLAVILSGLFMLIGARGGFSTDAVLGLVGAGSFFALIATAFFVGLRLRKNRNVEMNRIRNIIGQKDSYNLSKLASASGKNLKKIRKQLQKMIDKGEFGDTAYIDLGTNNFMRHPDAEPDDPEGFDYRMVYGDLFAKKKEEGEGEPEDDSDQARFNRIIGEIRRLNGEIRDTKVSERIDRIEGHTRHIFDYVTEHPEAMPQIRTFMNYYLPTTLKLLESYSRIERVGVAGENMKKSKENIESILDLLAVGFEQQVDQLFRNESIDITSDISVLETMMQKDGLNGKNDFDISAYANQTQVTDGYSDEITDEIDDSLGGAAAQKAPQKDDKK